MDSHVEIDEHTKWGDVESGQVVDLIDDGPYEVIHLRGHKKSMSGYESLTLALAPSYELVESLTFIEGQIDIYHRTKSNGIV